MRNYIQTMRHKASVYRVRRGSIRSRSRWFAADTEQIRIEDHLLLCQRHLQYELGRQRGLKNLCKWTYNRRK